MKKSTKKLTTEIFIQRSKLIHNDKYDYSKTIYTGIKKKLIITCPIHGDFTIRADQHSQRGDGCFKCGNNMIDKAQFVLEANKVHSNFYSYKKTNYINKEIKVVITCPIHGDFEQSPQKHLSGQKCPKCNGRLSKEEFISEANKIFNNKYDYSKIKFINMITKVEIICPKHGEFWQTPSAHLKRIHGCPSCGYNTSKAANKWLESFNNTNIIKEYTIYINNKRYKVDGYDPTTQTIYEYFGSFWHGDPNRKDLKEINPKNKMPYNELYNITLNRVNTFNNSNYKFIYLWGR